MLPLQTAYGRRDGHGRLMVHVIDHKGTVNQRRPQQQKVVPLMSRDTREGL